MTKEKISSEALMLIGAIVMGAVIYVACLPW